MNYKLRVLSWPLILAFLPALFGSLGQNLQQIFHFGPATTSVAQVSQSADQGVYVQTICSSSNGDIEEGNTGLGIITSSMIKTTATLTYNQNLKIWAAVADKPDGAVDSAPVISIREGNNQSLKSFYRRDTTPHREIMTFCGGTKALTVDLGWTKNTPPTCTGGQVLDPTTNSCKCPPPLILGSDGKCQGPLTLTLKVTNPSQPNPDGSYFTSDKITIQATVAGGPSSQTYTYAWLKNNKQLDPLSDDYTTGSSYSSRLSAGSYNFMAVVTAKPSGQTANGGVSFSVKAGTAPAPCTKDVWTCTDFAPKDCPSSGARTRTCSNKPVTITCPSQTTPMPTTTQACVPSTGKVNIVNIPTGDTFRVDQIPGGLKFQATVTKPDNSLDSSDLSYIWTLDNGADVLSKGWLGQFDVDLDVGSHNISVRVPVGNPPVVLRNSKTIKIDPAKICNNNSVQDIINSLKNNLPIQMPTADMAGWISQNEEAIKSAMESMSSCYPNTDDSYKKNPSAIFQKVYDQINRYTSLGYPLMINLRGPNLGHQMIALSISKQNAFGYFSIKALDPNGPQLLTLNCRPQLTLIAPNYYQRFAICNYPGSGNGILLSSNVYANWAGLDDVLAGSKVRDNPSQWLGTHFTDIPNFAGANTEGVCTGWSTFNTKMAFLLKECK